MKEKRRVILFLIILLLLAGVLFSSYCMAFSLHGDEYFSMGFANNTEDFLFLTQGTIDNYSHDGWLDGTFLKDWLTVKQGERFSYLSLYRNVRDDVHPPLYFMVLHTLCSFVPENIEASMIAGYAINMICMMGVLVFLYLISYQIIKERSLSLIAPILFMISNGAMSLTSYVRMYAMLSFLCMLCVFLHIYAKERTKTSFLTYFLIYGIIAAGGLTHYYFYVMYAVIFVTVIIYLLVQKDYKRVIQYLITVMCAAVTVILLYPYVFRHLLSSNRGVQATANLTSFQGSDFFPFLKDILFMLNDSVYSGKFVCYFAVAVILVIMAGISTLKNKGGHGTIGMKQWENAIFVGIVSIGYLLLLSRISYSSRWPYFSPVFALLMLITGVIFGFSIKRISIPYVKTAVLGVFLLILIVTLPGIITEKIGNHQENKAYREKMSAYFSSDVLFFYDDWNNLYDNEILTLMQDDEICTVSTEDALISDYEKILAGRHTKDNLLVYFPVGYSEEQNIINKLTYIGFTNPQQIEATNFDIYTLEQ